MKRSLFSRLLRVLCGASFLWLASPVPARASEWLIMVYLAGDNDLDSAGIDDIHEMEAAGRHDDVTVAVLMDRAEHAEWSETRRFTIQGRDELPEGLHSYDLTNTTCSVLGEINTGDPKNLKEFVEWAMKNHPAKRTLLVLWNHGGGWRDVFARAVGGARAAADDIPRISRLSRGIAWDDSDGQDFLETREVRSALEGFPKLSIIGMDACLMAMVEVAYELRDRAEFLVASQDLEPGAGWPYTTLLQGLYKQPTMGAEDLARLIVSAYGDEYKDVATTTQSAIRLAGLDKLAQDMAAVGRQLLLDLETENAKKPDFLDGKIAGFPKDKPRFVDLDGALEWLDGRYGAQLDAAARQARQTLKETVVANYAHKHHDARGLAIFPGGGPEASAYTPEIILWAKDTPWNDLLARIKEMEESTTDAQASDAASARWAVLIGVDNYLDPGIPPLRYAAKDVEYLKEVLVRNAHYEPERVLALINEDATLSKVRSTLGTWLPRTVGDKDMVMIYFSGHGGAEPSLTGATDDGTEKYMMLADSRVDDMYSTALPMSELSRIFTRIRADKLLLVMDACYSGASGGKGLLRPGMKAVGMSDSYLGQLAASEGTAILTASRASEISMESPTLGHGVFTYHLGEALRGEADADADGLVTLSEAYQYVSAQVPATARKLGATQNPVLKGELTGPFPLTSIRREPPSTEPAPAPASAPVEALKPERIPEPVEPAPAIAAAAPRLAVERRLVRGRPEMAATIHELPREGRHPSAWIGLYRADARHDDYLSYTFLKNLTDDGYTVPVPARGGPYEFRVFKDGGYECLLTSEPFMVE